MSEDKKYTAFVRAGGTCSWYCAEGKTEAATKAVQQYKRDFKHVFKIKKGVEYKVVVFDTTGIEEWVTDDDGFLHPFYNGVASDPIKDYEIVKVYA
jgi:hypothetical protein